jgi:hypothetical protein
VTGGIFASLDGLADGLPRVLALDRRLVRARAVERFGVDRMVDAYVGVYRQVIDAPRRSRSGSPQPESARSTALTGTTSRKTS